MGNGYQYLRLIVVGLVLSSSASSWGEVLEGGLVHMEWASEDGESVISEPGEMRARILEDGWVWTEWNSSLNNEISWSFRTVVTNNRAFLLREEPGTDGFTMIWVDRRGGEILGSGVFNIDGVRRQIHVFGKDPWIELERECSSETEFHFDDAWNGTLSVYETRIDQSLSLDMDASFESSRGSLVLCTDLYNPNLREHFDFGFCGLWDGCRAILVHPDLDRGSEWINLWGILGGEEGRMEGSHYWLDGRSCVDMRIQCSGKRDEKVWMDGWLNDLNAVEQLLPGKHPDFFRHINREEWSSGFSKIRDQLGLRNELHMRWALIEQVARVRDAHTKVEFMNPQNSKRLPFSIYRFEEGWFVTEVFGKEWQALLGMKIDSIGDVPMAELEQWVGRLISHENNQWRNARSPTVIVDLSALEYLGIGDGSRVAVGVSDPASGSSYSLDVQGKSSVECRSVVPISLVDPKSVWSEERKDLPHWYEISMDGKVLYLQWNACLHDVSPYNRFAGREWNVKGFFDKVLSLLKKNRYEKVIIDLRYNNGGNSAMGESLLANVKKNKRINRPEVLQVLIGRETFSAGTDLAIGLDQLTKATLWGEPTGGKPNCFGDILSYDLPETGAQVIHSTRYFQMIKSDPETLWPDNKVPVMFRATHEGRDPAMEAILGSGWRQRFHPDPKPVSF
ncbi:MAG: hypothetical protein JW706_10840 [Opitutales bacterium]|nr:hypothetical protein [Opitutales bacterium]